MTDTKTRIMDAAELLFAQHGFAATSVRQITAEAEVNVAAMHYHFGSKDHLIGRLFERRLGPLNSERLRLLELAEAGPATGAVERLVEAFIGPPLRLSRDPDGGGALCMRLVGRAFSDPGETICSIIHQQFEETARRFLNAFKKQLPDLSEEELCWRMHFMIGAMAHTMADVEKLHFLSEGLCDSRNVESMIARLVPFLSAALRSPMPSLPRERRPS